MSNRTFKPLELALMGLLSQQDRSGYDLLNIFSQTAMGGFSSSPGAIYPALKRLERAKSIKGVVKNRHTLRPRQVYSLTAAGQKNLEQELRKPVIRDDIVRRMDGVMLRFAFSGDVLGPKAAAHILEQLAHEIECYLPELKAQLAAIPKAAAVCGWHALQHGIDMYRANARWARKLEKELKATTKKS